MNRLTKYLDNNPKLRPYYLMWLRRSTKTINKWPEEKFINGVMDCYERHMGYRFDIHHPVLFTEKLQWYKVFYHHKDFYRITDKYLFKEYVREKLGDGFTIPCYGAWENVEDLERAWESLPQEFVLKANLQANSLNIKIIRNKSEIDFKSIKSELRSWLKPFNTLLNSWDSHFYCGTPRILAEKYMSNFDDQLYDYKFFCFKGEPFCMYVGQERGKDITGPKITFYDLDWNKLPVQYGKHKNGEASKPVHFEQMVEIARTLSKDFPFVRVDFFDTENHLYVAELTFTPGGGCTPYYPEEFNKLMGDKMEIVQSYRYNGKVLGVLGGMGPLATADFLKELALAAPARCDQEHPKMILIEQPQTPDRTLYLLGKGDSPEPFLREGLQRLSKMGADYIAVPCNTSHYFINTFEDKLRSKIINIVDETIKEAKYLSPQGAWLTATLGTMKTKIYQECAKRLNYNVLIPNKEQQEEINYIVDCVKSNKMEEAAQIYNNVIKEMWKSYDLPIIAACTELPLAYEETGLPINKMISSVEALAKGCVKKLYGGGRLGFSQLTEMSSMLTYRMAA